MSTNNPQETGDARMETSPVTSADEETPAGDAQPSLLGRLATRIRDARASHRLTAQEREAQERLVRLRKEQEAQRQRETASQAAVSRRRAARAGAETETADEIAPVPHWMKVLGVWFGRSFGAAPRVAGLVVSGVFTVKVGMDAPLSMAWPVALAFTLGLEGAVWYLSVLYEKTRLEGDSTFSLRAGQIGIILLITGLIGGHAVWVAMGRQAIWIGLPFSDRQLPLESAVPALTVALMSAIGTFVWAKGATFKHRVRLRQQDLIDTRAPKFSTWSWILDFPATFLALRYAVRYRVTSPSLAMAERRLWADSGKPRVWPLVETLEAEIVSDPSPVSRPRSISAETPRLSPVSRVTTPPVSSLVQLPVASSPKTPAVSGTETDQETQALIDRIIQETEGDQAARVGRLKEEARLAYAGIAERLSMSKAHAGRLGSRYYERLAVSQETGDDTGDAASVAV